VLLFQTARLTKMAMLDSMRTKLLCAAFYCLGVGSALLMPALIRLPDAKASSVQGPNRPLVQARTSTPVPPCGRIVAIEVPLANSDGVFPDREQRLANPRWFFEGTSPDRFAQLLSGCELRPSEQRILLDQRGWQTLSNGIVVTPPEQLIWSLSPRSRAKIYSMLARNPTNFPQCYPFRFLLSGFDQRFSRSDLPVSDIEKIRRLTYTNSGYLCFTDLQAMKPILTEKEFKDLIETLYQTPAYFVRVHLTADSDVNSLVKYWGKGGRERLIAPLLTSLTKAPEGRDLGVGYFMPPFARCRLYTYPYTWNDHPAGRQDCFFTSMNFFNSSPNTNFFDRAYTSRVLRSEYSCVQDPPAYGDIVALSNASGEIFHTCVYIAEDFVFTKNGADTEEPWVLMKLPDVLMLYNCPDRSGCLSFFRRKDMS
jgi:hypothetical protein